VVWVHKLMVQINTSDCIFWSDWYFVNDCLKSQRHDDDSMDVWFVWHYDWQYALLTLLEKQPSKFLGDDTLKKKINNLFLFDTKK